MSEREIGEVTHWFGHLNVAAVQLKAGALHVGDTIHIKGYTTDCVMRVGSMEIDHHTIKEAQAGENVGLKVPEHVHEHDKVYIVS